MDLNREARKWRRAMRDALLSGTAASIASTIVLSACSKCEQNSAAGALNGPSQWLWGEAEAYTRRATLKHTVVGYAIHHAMSICWATLHERAFGRIPRSVAERCIDAAATTAIAYVVDYHATPRRLRPGFRKHLSPQSIFATYAAFAIGLATAAVLRERTRNYSDALSARGSPSTSLSASSQSSSSRPGTKPRRSARQ